MKKTISKHMNEFIEFIKSNNAKNKIWYKIADKLNDLSVLIFNNKKGDTIKTQRVKVELVKLGHDLEKRVYANRLSKDGKQVEEINEHLKKIGRFDPYTNGFKETEWLFDIHWYTDVEGEDYVPKSLDLVAECEWKKVREIKDNKGNNVKAKHRNANEIELSGIKYDFQKLLTSNAILKLMICRLSYKSEMISLKDYIIKTIKSNQQLKKGSHFLIICYLNEEKKIYFLRATS